MTNDTARFQGSGVTVLAVDDDETVSTMVQTMLGRAGLNCLTAASAQEGHQILQRHDVDLVVSDIDMPATNGLEFVRAIKRTSPDLPVILITGNGARYTRQMAEEAGADEFLPKPFHFYELLGKISAFVTIPSAQLSECNES